MTISDMRMPFPNRPYRRGTRCRTVGPCLSGTTPVRVQQRIRQLEGQGLCHTRMAGAWCFAYDGNQVRVEGLFALAAGGGGRERFPGDGRVRACGGRVVGLGFAYAAQAAAYRAPSATGG